MEKLTYIDKARMFFEYQQQGELTAGQIALFYTLLAIHNQCGRQEWFTVAGRRLSQATGMTREGIRKARTQLKERGLLDFKTDTTRATQYHLNFDETGSNSWQVKNGDWVEKLASLGRIVGKTGSNSCTLTEKSITENIYGHSNEMPTPAKSSQKKPKTDTRQKEIDEHFETLWKMYPVKRGKAKVSKARRKELLKITPEEMARAIDRYKAELTDMKYVQYGSTFFNGGYIDFLDDNYQAVETTEPQSKYRTV